MPVLTAVECQARVARIWAETLGVENVQPADNFFTLGGDSIMVTIMVMQVEQALGVTLNPDAAYDFPTLEAFVADIQSGADA
jgi:acyl carrier protein